MDVNENIVKKLNEYINWKGNPQYAIMLNGGWGCGKTFFVKKYVEDCNKETIGMAWYISVFGVKSMEEIDVRLFEAAHPILADKNQKRMFSLGYGILRGAVKHKLRVEVNDYFQPILELAQNKDGVADSCKILFVDDVERAHIPMKELFGYFSQIIDKSTRVVFIADDRKLKDCSGFKDLKEKLILETYTIAPEYNNAVRTFWKTEFHDKYEHLVDKLMQIILKLKIYNLRDIRRIIHKWSVLVSSLPSDIRDEQSYIEDIFEEFFVLYVSYIAGKYDDFAHSSDRQDVDKIQKIMKEEWKTYKVGNENPYYYPELKGGQMWPNVIVGGQYDDSSWLSEQFKDSHNTYNARRKEREDTIKNANRSLNQLRTCIYYNNGPHDVKLLFETMEEEFDQGKYLRFDEIMTFVQIYLTFMQNEVLPEKYTIHALVEKLNHLLVGYRDEIYALPGIVNASREDVMRVRDDSLQQCIDKIFAAAQSSAGVDKKDIFCDKEAFLSYIEDRQRAVTEMTDIKFLEQFELYKLFTWLGDDIHHHRNLLSFLEFRYRINFGNDELHTNDYSEKKHVDDLIQKYETKCRELIHTFRLDYRDFKEILAKYKELSDYMEEQITQHQAGQPIDGNQGESFA